MSAELDFLERFPRAGLVTVPTPLERLDALSRHFDLDLWIKRDDLTGLGFGGNKVRQLDFYMGAALAKGADVILITGAVQSNYVRTAAAAAARLGMGSVLQLERRVPDTDSIYETSGNILLNQILGAELMTYAEGEDETGADRALRMRAEELKASGSTPYVIPLGLNNPPLGALGYMRAAQEIMDQRSGFDAVVVASGSGVTHAGLLAGLRACGANVPVHGICVRRDATAQRARLIEVGRRLGQLTEKEAFFGMDDIHTWDGSLAPGYGQIGERTREALHLMARKEGLFLDPVYTAKAFAGVRGLLENGQIKAGQKVLFVHTGGLPALFAYQTDLTQGE